MWLLLEAKSRIRGLASLGSLPAALRWSATVCGEIESPSLLRRSEHRSCGTRGDRPLFLLKKHTKHYCVGRLSDLVL